MHLAFTNQSGSVVARSAHVGEEMSDTALETYNAVYGFRKRKRPRLMRRADLPSVACRLIVCVIAVAVLADTGSARATTASLHASFSPDKLGASTTITVGFHVGERAVPLTRVAISLPRGLTAGFNGLGVATCTVTQLRAHGPRGCPSDALVGRGHALVSVPFGSQQLFEPVQIKMFMAPATEEHTAMVFYASGTEPVISEVVFEGSLLGGSGLFGAELDTFIPPLPGLPGSPGAAIVSMQTQIGPKGLKYYRHARGVTVSYTPRGFDVPVTCPRGGFPFAALLTFSDGPEESARTRVPCPITRPHNV
jgi:hypothetical protein